jgi:SagB-type dehydrogenase family enzyme
MIVGLNAKVHISFENNLVTWQNSTNRLVMRVANNEVYNVRQSLQKLLEGDVLLSSLHSEIPVERLVELGMLIVATHEAALESIRIHNEASFPINLRGELTSEELRTLVQKAKNRRFSQKISDVRRFDIPPALRCLPSVACDIQTEKLFPMSEDDVYALLRAWHISHIRLYPSAGALYPVRIVMETYWDKYSTLHIYSPQTDELHKIKRPFASTILSLDSTLDKAPTRIWFVASINDITLKYGLRGYRYALLEAGHAAQVMIQLLNWRNIETRPFGGYDDQAAATYLGLQPGEIIVHLLGVYPVLSNKLYNSWILGSETKYSTVAGRSLHYSISFGGIDHNGNSIYGFGIDEDEQIAKLRSCAELAERIAGTV